MAEPYDRPPVGSGAKLYRMIRDNAYYVAGTVLSLLPEQVNPLMHEEVTLEAPNTDALHAVVTGLHDRVKTIEIEAPAVFQMLRDEFAGVIDGFERRIADLEAAAKTPKPNTPARTDSPKAE